MNPLFQTGSRLETFCRNKGWQFCFIGGIAVQRWGEPRFTQDVDLSLLTSFKDEESYIDALVEHFPPRRPDAAEFALTHRVLLLKDKSGVDMDISLGGLPFEERIIERATTFEFLPECVLTTISAEDLVVLKAFADRDKDWADINGVLMRQSGKLNTSQILSELTPLVELKEDQFIIPRLEEKLEKFTQ